MCRRGNNHFDVHFSRIGPVLFPSKAGKDAILKEEMNGEVFFSHQSQHFSCIDNIIKVLFPICTLNWRISNIVSRQGKDINRRNESTIIIII